MDNYTKLKLKELQTKIDTCDYNDNYNLINKSQPAVVFNMHYLIYNLYIEIAHVTDPVELARIKGEDWLKVAAQQGKEQNI